MEKVCSACGGPGPFYRNRSMKDGLSGQCKACHRVYYDRNADAIKARARKWNVDHQSEKRIAGRQWYRDNRVDVLDRKRQRDFGIDPVQFKEMSFIQGDVCAICKRPEMGVRNGVLKQMAIDHDHDSGEVRGLLCHHCNTGIGNLMDSPELLQRAIDYVVAASVVIFFRLLLKESGSV